MLKKILLPAILISSLFASGCIVHTHGRSRQGSYRSSCPPGHQRSDGSCRPKGQAKKDTVIIRDHRR
jgi:hypothetical protein